MKAVAALKGRISIVEIESGALPAGHVRVRNEYSAISPGTEMSILRSSSDRPWVLGYSSVGIVEEIGENVTGVAVGQRVACYGAPYVGHAQVIDVPSNLTAAVPEGVSAEEAAFGGLGAIAIHALRVADLRFGESTVVVGLGILGNITAQIGSAAALIVAGMDLNPERVGLLRDRGLAHAFSEQALLEERLPGLTGGYGADSVLLCASGPGQEMFGSAMRWIRDRGKIVVVGDVTTEFSRGQMFGKEAQVLISRAGGPGRYDASYERDNRDYPIGYVRWTEGRNVGEYVRLLAERRIEVAPLITDVYPFERAAEAYEKYEKAPSQVLGTLLKY